jgi:hypothetical protein
MAVLFMTLLVFYVVIIVVASIMDRRVAKIRPVAPCVGVNI